MKVLILDNNTEYTQRFKYYMNKKNPDLQITACDNLDNAKEILGSDKYDVVLFDSSFDKTDIKEISGISDDTAFAYVSETNEIVNETETIFKYRTVSVLYSRICIIYEKKKNRIVKKSDVIETGDKQCEIITFLPVHGGAGSSTVAVASAVALANENEVLFIDLQQRPSDTIFFDCETKKNITDLISLFKTKYSESAVYQLLREMIAKDRRQNSEKISCIKGFTNILESSSMSEGCLKTMLSTLVTKFDYRYIIIDADFIVSPLLDTMVAASNRLVFVSSDSDVSEVKMHKIHRYLEVIGRESDESAAEKYLVFNQYFGLNDESSMAGSLEVIARIPRYRTDNNVRITSRQIVEEINKSGVLADLSLRFAPPAEEQQPQQ